jgi:predicted metal-binding membrane protein
VDRLKASATALDRGIESMVRNDRRTIIGALGTVIIVAWVCMWMMARMDSMEMTAQQTIDPAALGLTFVMWVVMMAAMMLPGAAPTIVLYGSLVRKSGARGAILPGVWIFAGAYLLVWAAFSVAATLLQALLDHWSLLTPVMTSASNKLSAIAFIGAGLFQLTPLKQACLGKCRNPLEFLAMHWRAGPAGAFRMGFEHGLYCVGCCWALMLLLFVAGVMNLAWVAVIAAVVLLEKLHPAAIIVMRVLSAVSIVTGVVLLTIR